MKLVQPYVFGGVRFYPAFDTYLEPDTGAFEYEREEVRVVRDRPKAIYAGSELVSPGESVEEYRQRMARERYG
jgi:hypothetical protein